MRTKGQRDDAYVKKEEGGCGGRKDTTMDQPADIVPTTTMHFGMRYPLFCIGGIVLWIGGMMLWNVLRKIVKKGFYASTTKKKRAMPRATRRQTRWYPPMGTTLNLREIAHLKQSFGLTSDPSWTALLDVEGMTRGEEVRYQTGRVDRILDYIRHHQTWPEVDDLHPCEDGQSTRNDRDQLSRTNLWPNHLVDECYDLRADPYWSSHYHPSESGERFFFQEFHRDYLSSQPHQPKRYPLSDEVLDILDTARNKSIDNEEG